MDGVGKSTRASFAILNKIPPDVTKLLISIRTITSLIFTQIKHPLAIGLMLLLQTTIICLSEEQYTEDYGSHTSYS